MIEKILLFILILMFSLSGVMYIKILTLSNNNKNLLSDIEVIKQESKKEIDRINEINIRSKNQLNKSQKRINELLLSKVPENCRKAITWSIKEARNFDS